jgi:hypothetical protein
VSNDEIDKLTIGEARAIAERAGEALRVFRELGITPPAAAHAAPAPSAAPAIQWSAEEQAKRDALALQRQMDAEKALAEALT